MARLGRRFPVILSGLILLPVILFVSLWLYWSATYVSSKIVDFHPSYFQAKADADFFYSIGDELKYSDQFDSCRSNCGLLASPQLAHQVMSVSVPSFLTVIVSNMQASGG
jgi:hypothetical protein